MNNPINIPNIRIITVSGRIASGSTTLAKKLAEHLGWKSLEGGEIFWEQVRSKLNLSQTDTDKRPDMEDKLFDESLRQILTTGKNMVLETKLAGFFAKGFSDIFKILVICEDNANEDQTQIRIDRLVNREEINMQDAKKEVLERERNDIEKWRRLYAGDDKNWTYWDRQYYNIVINTFFHNPEESFNIVMEAIKKQEKS